MLDIKLLRTDYEEVAKKISRRGDKVSFEPFLALENRRREILVRLEALRCRKNKASQEIPRKKKLGEPVDDIMREMKIVSLETKELEEQKRIIDSEFGDTLLTFPNIPNDSVPDGNDETSNIEIRKWGVIPSFDFPVLPHYDIGEGSGIFDFERASKLSGSRFCVMFGDGAKLERALINFMLDMHVEKHGYTEVAPPFLVNRTSMTGTGQLPKFEDDLFRTEPDDMFLIPTAEVPLTNIHRDEILKESDLPLLYTAYTPCFRREAGSYGRDVRGLIRQHQFNKVELVKLAHPDRSYDELEALLCNAEAVLKALELPYRVVNLCAGDLGFSAAKTFDIEVWIPSQERYCEISSCSNFEDFQSRRAGIRFRSLADKKKIDFVHTINGSGLAVGRTVVAILENNQTKDGRIVIPSVLRQYFSGREYL